MWLKGQLPSVRRGTIHSPISCEAIEKQGLGFRGLGV